MADVAEAVLARDPAGFRRDLGAVDPTPIRDRLQAFAALFGWAPRPAPSRFAKSAESGHLA